MIRHLLTNVYYVCLILLMPLILSAQLGSPTVIDQGPSFSGLTDLQHADLNQDGQKDLVYCRGYNGDQLAFLRATGNITFANALAIDSNLLNAKALAVGYLNGDQWPDIVACGQQNGTLNLYLNDSGSFKKKLPLDSGIFFPHDIVIADFDTNQTQDIVFIGQHSIDIHLGNGDGTFTKSPILTTSSASRILELFDLEKIDLNGDSLMDLVAAETLGATVYLNQGNGNFAKSVLNNTALSADRVDLFDVDGDRDEDILLRHSNKAFDWFENIGNGQFNHRGSIPGLPKLDTWVTLDLNGDSLSDIYGAIGNQTLICFNNSTQTFSNQQMAYQDTALNFITEMLQTDLNGDNKPDILWSAISGHLAYQLNQSKIGLRAADQTSVNLLYPNPAHDLVKIHGSNAVRRIEVYDANGHQVLQLKLHKQAQFRVEDWPSGTYLVRFFGNQYIGTQFLVIP